MEGSKNTKYTDVVGSFWIVFVLELIVKSKFAYFGLVCAYVKGIKPTKDYSVLVSNLVVTLYSARSSFQVSLASKV